jgi:DNA mismatch repair ATPase MutS
VYPELVATGLTSFDATQLAHPLLPSATRVANDVTVGPRDTFLLVTGSNMAGKSTLLRSIGLNALLAQLGAPVCATSLRMPPVRVRTSIQIRDAIEQGLSLFMSEVLRLKSIVDAASSTEGPMLLYLADEMLHGTNTEERRIAVVAVIRHLLRAGAIGAVATHDVELSSDPALAEHARPIYFVEQFRETEHGLEMWFDYRLRPGLATSRNALKLIELVGLATSDGRQATSDRRRAPGA